MATSSAIFSGSSRFSSDFQSVIQRSVSIASLPGDQLRRQLTSLSDESSAVTALQTSTTSLDSAINRLDTAMASTHTTASVSAGGVVSTSLTDPLQGTYSINVTALGSPTTTLSKDTLTTVADPAASGISTAASLTLTVGGTSRTLTPASHSLNDLAAAINANADLGVRATIVRFGTESAPSYRLSVQSAEIGSKSISLNDGASSLLDTVTTGTPMTYRLNGATTDLTADSRTVTIAPGLKVTAVGTGSAAITVSATTAPISDALSNFANAYNSVVDALDVQHGEKAGVLSGQSIVSELGRTIRSLLSYTSGTQAVNNLTALGLTFDDKGKLSFDATAFNTASTANPEALTTFLGRSGQSGFLQMAHAALASATASTQGSLDSIQASVTAQNARIADEDARVTLLREQLTAQMSSADSLIASLEQQVTYVTGLFAAQTQKNN